MSSKLSSAFSAASALVALLSLTNSTAPLRPTCSMRWARPGKERMPSPISSCAQAERSQAAKAAAGVLPVMGAAQRRGAREIEQDSSSVCSAGKAKARRSRPDRSKRWPAPAGGCWRSPTTGCAGLLQTIGKSPRTSRRRRPTMREIGGRDQPLLDRGIIFHRAVAVEMVGRQVEQDADARIERGREIDLEGRTFDHVDALRPPAAQVENRRRRYCRPAARRSPASRRIWAISAVVVHLPLVPVMAISGAPGAQRAARGRTIRCRR